jgi:hypothetical protein
MSKLVRVRDGLRYEAFLLKVDRTSGGGISSRLRVHRHTGERWISGRFNRAKTLNSSEFLAENYFPGMLVTSWLNKPCCNNGRLEHVRPKS